jgi:hypothetical protein
MENKENNHQAEITGQLIDQQQEQAKQAIDQIATELKVGTVEERANPYLGWNDAGKT